ncbi:hypothetical protein [Paenibacillus sp. GYB003]|uniref:hypothetical protein n=1 Tax=Paenibacillus sp. GYB003 TaxID=2994392 RepID=UPI002F966012
MATVITKINIKAPPRPKAAASGFFSAVARSVTETYLMEAEAVVVRSMFRYIFGYSVYLAVLSAASFLFYQVLKIWIQMGRFTAADAPPGDISIAEKVVYSYVVPIGFGIIMIVFSLVFRRLLMNYSVHLSAIAIFAIIVPVIVYFITQFRVLAFP